jgi:hypothetical protein
MTMPVSTAAGAGPLRNRSLRRAPLTAHRVSDPVAAACIWIRQPPSVLICDLSAKVVTWLNVLSYRQIGTGDATMSGNGSQTLHRSAFVVCEWPRDYDACDSG